MLTFYLMIKTKIILHVLNLVRT